MSNDNPNIYSEEEALQASIEYFNGDDMAAGVWLKKYALRDKQGNLYEKTPEDMHRRIARELARIDKKYPNPKNEDHYFNLLKDFKYVVPQGSPMFGIGNKFQIVSLSNCFVIGAPEGSGDSYGAIMKMDEEQVQLMKRRGGVGHDLSQIRPNNSIVKNSAMTSTGVASYMERYSNSTREVAQCIEGNQNVLTRSGLKKIMDVEIGEEVWTKQGWVDVINVLKSRKKVYEVTTKYGYKIQTSEDHIFSTNNGIEKRLKDLSVGDNVDLLLGTTDLNVDYYKFPVFNYKRSDYNNSNRMSEIDFPEYLTEDLAWALGLLYGDGTIIEHSITKKIAGIGCSFSSKEKDLSISEKYVNIMLDVFGGVNIRKKEEKGNWFNLNIFSTSLVEFLKENGLLKQNSSSQIFPELIKKSPISVQMSFLSGYFDADGYASGKKKGYVFNSVNKDFIQECKNILMSVGIVTKTHIEERSKTSTWQDMYSLVVVGGYAQEMFVEHMNESIKVQDLKHVSKRDTILTSYRAMDFGVKHNNYSYIPDNTQNISTRAYGKLIQEDIDIDLPEILIKDEIVSIKESEVSDTYDLSLSREHLFWCNGYYVHNSGRRGALMLSINISHPDAEDFVDAKMEAGKVTGANISVKITDDFMEVVKRTTKEDLEMHERLKPVAEDPEAHIESVREYTKLRNKIIYNQTFTYEDGSVLEKPIIAKKLWDKIIFNAWKSAEPGVMFWDQMQRESIGQCYEKFGFGNTSTNPCGELLLPPYDSCRLLVLNLYSYVINPFTKSAKFDFDLFREHAHEAIRMMDNIVDMELEKIDAIIAKIESDPENSDVKRTELELWAKIRYMCEQGRRTGVGITAEGDMLAALGFTYGTPKATEFADDAHAFYATEVLRGSVNLSEERGSFPLWDWELEKENPYLNRIFDRAPEIKDKMLKVGRRNIALMTIAPTGTVSMMTQTTSGIEPAFLVNYTRRRKINPQERGVRVDFVDEVGDSWTEYNVFHHKFIDWFHINQLELRKELGEENVETYPLSWCKTFLEKLNPADTQILVESSPYYKAMANDVDWVEKVRMQGKVQQWIDHSISVTVNLPEHVDTDLVNAVYLTAWESGCKGCTIYRDGSRSGVLITKEEKKEEKIKAMFEDKHAPKRPKRLECDVIHFMNKGDKWICFVGLMEGRPYEIFTGAYDKLSEIPGSTERGIIERRKIDGVSQYIFKYEDKSGEMIECCDLKHSFDETFSDVSKMVSAILRHGMPLEYVVDLLDNLNLDGDLITTWKTGVKRILKRYVRDGQKAKGKCQDCGSTNLAYQDGCLTCLDCGSSKCG